jgi:hypothetical protein
VSKLFGDDMPHPCWWNPNHHTLDVELFDPERRVLNLASKSARLTISSKRTNGTWGWLVGWSIQHSPVESVQGMKLWTSDQLMHAFALDEEGVWGIPGLFRRCHRFLNVPWIGTGEDGDPNLSVELTHEMLAAVKALPLARRRGGSTQPVPVPRHEHGVQRGGGQLPDHAAPEAPPVRPPGVLSLGRPTPGAP